MKHSIFKLLGDAYPRHLEAQYDRILTKLEALWDTPEIHDYFSDLLIDKRGGRKGFPKEVLNEIIALREFHEFETFRRAERREDAIRELGQRNIAVSRNNFLAALRDGDQFIIDLFVRSNFNVNVVDAEGCPALLYALKKGYTIIAKILLEGGADPNSRDKLGLSPLLLACGKPTYGYQAIAELLVEKGAMINVKDALGFTPLLLALSGGTIEVAKLLIERGADIHVVTRKGISALGLAERSSAPQAAELTRLLISRGATRGGAEG